MTRHIFRVSDAVEFYNRNDRLTYGYIASIRGMRTEVITESGEEYRTFLYALKPRKGVKPKRVYTQNQLKKSEFSLGSQVAFTDSENRRLQGSIIRMNPKRARIQTSDQFWDVPYAMLEKCDSDEAGGQAIDKLDAIAELAEQLLTEHHLSDWRFSFDFAAQRGGSCSYTHRLITLSEQFCLHADHNDVVDAILHEIAHALVGPHHGHDSVWLEKALEIGCSGNLRHNICFTPPNYIMSCRNCGWVTERQKRRNLACSTCGNPVTYERFTNEHRKLFQHNSDSDRPHWENSLDKPV